MNNTLLEIQFVCPVCRAPVEIAPDGYTCSICFRRFPVLFGIPDFRIRSDRYLSLEEERRKAERLNNFAQDATFMEVVDYYYRITDDVPSELAARYCAYIHSGRYRGAHVVNQLTPDAYCDTLLDVGCGSGGLLVSSAAHYRNVVGLDIGLRWLVICRKHLEEHNVGAILVCADVQAMPFSNNSFDHVAAVDLIEHVFDVEDSLRAIHETLKPKGKLWVSAGNRFSLGPNPSTRIWALGYIPHTLRSSILKRYRGVDSLRHVNLVSPFSIVRKCRKLGFRRLSLRPLDLSADATRFYPYIDRLLFLIYLTVRRVPILRRLLVIIGPAFEVLLEKQGK